jgi:hypothetical protein
MVLLAAKSQGAVDQRGMKRLTVKRTLDVLNLCMVLGL